MVFSRKDAQKIRKKMKRWELIEWEDGAVAIKSLFGVIPLATSHFCARYVHFCG